MTTNQEGVHLAVRDITGTSRSYNEDWHALFDSESIAAGTFNERMLGWINATLSTSYTNVNEAMQAFAVEQGFANWASMNTFAVTSSLAAEFLATFGPYGMVMNFADDASIEITDEAGLLDFSSSGQVESGALVGPGALVSYPSPSVKYTEQADGNLGFQAHNLYLNSAAPANQTITTLSGATYALTSTGAFSHTINAAATSVTATGLNLVANSTFDGGSTSGWTLTLGSSINGTGNVLNVVAGGGGGRATTAAIPLVNGQSYRLIAAMSAGTPGLLRLGTASDGSATGTIYNNTGFAVGTIDTVVTAAATGNYYLSVGTAGGSVTAIWDNIYLIDTTTGARVFEFTASAASVTTSATSGSGTVHLRRTPSVDTYIATTTAAAYDVPYKFSGGVRQCAVWEPTAATNLFLNNRAPVTQNITTTAQTYTLSFYGTGSVTLSGTATATLNGTGANDRVKTTVTATAGTLTCTVSGTIDLVQVETGTVATSPIITYGAAVARAADTPNALLNLFPAIGTAYVIYAKYKPQSAVNLVTNPTFDGASVAGWTTTLGTSINGTGNVLNIVPDAGGGRATTGAITLVSGNTYRLVATLVSATGAAGVLRIGTAADGSPTGTIYNSTSVAVGTVDTTVTAATTGAYYVSVGVLAPGTQAAWDGIYLIDESTGATTAIRLDDTTANELVSLGNNASGQGLATVTDGGAAQAAITSGTITSTAFHRLAMSVEANNVRLVVNGGTEVQDTSVALPTLTRLLIGAGGGMDLVQLAILPGARTEAQLQALGA